MGTVITETAAPLSSVSSLSDEIPALPDGAQVRAPRRERISWALYDFANTVF